MSNEIAASVEANDPRVGPLTAFILKAELDLICLHSGIGFEDAETIARTIVAFMDEDAPPCMHGDPWCEQCADAWVAATWERVTRP